MPSMDIVSKPNLHEVENALEQAQKELKTRWDFKDTGAEIEEVEGGYKLVANTEVGQAFEGVRVSGWAPLGAACRGSAMSRAFHTRWARSSQVC